MYVIGIDPHRGSHAAAVLDRDEQVRASAGRSGGAPETVQPGLTGTVVDGRDVAEVAAAAGGLLADPDRAAEWGANGRRWVSRDWNWDSSAERLADLLSA